MDFFRVSTISVLILLHLVTEVHLCTYPSTCVRAGDSCREIQAFINCKDEQSRGCSQTVRAKYEASIKLTKSTFSKSPYSCVFSKGSINLRCGFAALFLATLLRKVICDLL